MLFSAQHTVSVVIPVHNRGENFRRCLAGVTQLSPAPTEAIVVIDGVSQNLLEEQQTNLLDAKIVRLPTDCGFIRMQSPLGSFGITRFR